MTTIITHAAFKKHHPDPGHPECPARITTVLDALKGLDGIDPDLVDAPEATPEDLMLCHPRHHVEKVLRLMPRNGRMKFDADTSADGGTREAALRSAGGALLAVDMVLSGATRSAFVAARPPGHHATTTKVMGFCFFGNTAIAAKHALERHGLSRVAIVDFDVHHGNGTQDLLWDEPRTLFVSSHQGNFWPGSGVPSQEGAHNNVLNIPLANRTTGLDMREQYEGQVFPRLRRFKPELLILSAGFDAHIQDDMSGLRWNTEDYSWITRRLLEETRPFTQGRTVSCLEGGYDLPSLGQSVAAHVSEMAK
jgi:acetoin utilization deacetylase AcuC-like enzyme